MGLVGNDRWFYVRVRCRSFYFRENRRFGKYWSGVISSVVSDIFITFGGILRVIERKMFLFMVFSVVFFCMV